MRIFVVLAAGAAFGTLGPGTAEAIPTMPQKAAIVGNAATAVDWHPSRSHWDHHYHSHQNSMRYRDPTEVERSSRRVRNPEWSEYRSRGDGRVHRY